MLHPEAFVQKSTFKPISLQVRMMLCSCCAGASFWVVTVDQCRPIMTPWCLWLQPCFLELHLALPWPFAQTEFAFLVFTSFPYQFSHLFCLPADPLGSGSVNPLLRWTSVEVNTLSLPRPLHMQERDTRYLQTHSFFLPFHFFSSSNWLLDILFLKVLLLFLVFILGGF